MTREQFPRYARQTRSLAQALAAVANERRGLVPPIGDVQAHALLMLAGRITYYRTLTNWTRSELARRAGLSATGVAHVERAERRVRPSTLGALAEAFAGGDRELAPRLFSEFVGLAGCGVAAEAGETTIEAVA